MAGNDRQRNAIRGSLDEWSRALTDDETEQQVIEREVYVEVAPENALLYQNDGSIVAGHFTLTKTGIIQNGEATKEEWQELGGVLKNLHQSIQWLVGDWVVYGETKWKETYEHIAEVTGLDVKTIYDYAYVARAVHFSVRTETLSFGHHKLVAGFKSVKTQQQWLEYANENHLTVSAMRQQIKAQLPSPADQGGQTIVDEFSADYAQFAKQQLVRAKRAGDLERRQMADLLRRLADAIEEIE